MAEWVIAGKGGFKLSLDEVVLAIQQATFEGLLAGAEEVVKAARLQFNGQHPPGTARTAGGNRPQSVSENLKGSIHRTGMPNEVTRGVWTAEVGPTMVYARRIELGFKGADSLGRVYNQRPYPYMRPGLRVASPNVRGILANRWRSVLAG